VTKLAAAGAATEATKPTLVPRSGRRTTASLVVATGPARTEAMSLNTTVEHGVVQFDDAQAWHAIATREQRGTHGQHTLARGSGQTFDKWQPTGRKRLGAAGAGGVRVQRKGERLCVGWTRENFSIGLKLNLQADPAHASFGRRAQQRNRECEHLKQPKQVQSLPGVCSL